MISVIKGLLMLSIHFLTFFVPLLAHAILYNGSQPGISILDNSNFTQFLNNKDTASIIEFYNSWCGHCIRFAPVWKNFARDIVSWSPVAKVGVVDCAEDNNLGLCRQFDIIAFPSVRYFWHHYDSKSGLPPLSGKIDDPDQMRHDFIDYLAAHWNRTVPKSWPDLELLNPATATEWDQFARRVSNKDILLIVEDENSYLGREVLLDLSQFKDKVVIRRLKFDSPWLKTLNVDVYNIPYVLQITNGSSEPVIYWRLINPHDDLRKSVSNFIASDYKLGLIGPASSSSTSGGQIEADANSHEQMPDDLYLSDLYRSLHWTLYKQIPLHKTLNSTKLEIVKRVVEVTADHFPFDSSEARSFVTMLSQWLSTKVHSLDTDEYVNALTMFDENDALPKYDEWRTCRGSEPKYRGYPCSLWLFWHSLTVDEYLQQKNDPMKYSQHKVLRTMKDYIANFFSCTDCARHFGEMAAKMETSLIYPNSSVLWLWKAHNQVNRRLAGDATEDPYHKKIQYPAQSLCLSCWNKAGEFNESEVSNFLLERYKRTNIIGYQKIETSSAQAKADPLVSSYSNDFSRPEREWTWPNIFLSRLDISLCLLLYMLTSFMLLAFCFILSIKKRSSRKRDLRTKYPMNP